MRLLANITAVLMAITVTNATAQSPQLNMWYRQPAGKIWENALPIGNGRLGAMVYGNTGEEIIQLNEHTLWSGGPNRNDNLLALDSMAEIRSLIYTGQHKKAEALANKTIISKTSHGQMFQPAGELRLLFPGHGSFTHYRRELDIARAVATTQYTVDGVVYTRKYIASFTDRVVAVQLTASQPKRISFTAFYSTPYKNTRVSVSRNRLSLTGTGSDHEGIKGLVQYECITGWNTTGGTVHTSDTSVSITGADAVTLYISIATNFRSYNDVTGNAHLLADNYLNHAIRKPFGELLRMHTQYYRHYFDRVSLRLGNSVSNDLPTDERLKKFASSGDPAFAALYFQYGRYLLISSSQPGGQPANLQGIWNNKIRPPWDSKYTININAEMNYWPAEKTNLEELHQPFLKMVEELSATGRQTARTMYGTRGWMAHHNTDIWRATGAVDGAFWGSWVNGGGWSSQHLWEHYLYNGDKAFLERSYPALRDAALFYLDFLTRYPGRTWLVVAPDMSPENAPASHGGSSIDAGVTMTNQIIFDVFSTAIRAAGLLGKDRRLADSLRVARSLLPPMQIGQYGQLQEWIDDLDNPKDNHRHVSHLYGLFPSSQLSAYQTPELYSASKTTLLQRGDVSTGWSMGWKVNWWARMLDGNHAYKLIRDQLTPVGTNEGGGGTYNNLFDAHPPFQIDGNFGCTSGITEMLMQSSGGAIHLLPALPDAWSATGIVTGLRARGGFDIQEISWSNGRVVRLKIVSRLGGNLRLRLPNQVKPAGAAALAIAKGENSNPFFQLDKVPAPLIAANAPITLPKLPETFLYDMPTRKGETITFTSIP